LVAEKSQHIGHFAALERNDAPLAKCIRTELRDLIDLVVQEGLLEKSDSHAEDTVRLTAKAWTLLEPFDARNSRVGFIALHFDASLNEASQAIHQAIEATGFHAIRIDQQHFEGKICDRVIADIRRSRFIVADVTGHRQNVYYEAGFAEALGKPIFWTRHKDEKEEAFDVRQYQYIIWDSPDDLRDKLINAIRARLPDARPEEPPHDAR